MSEITLILIDRAGDEKSFLYKIENHQIKLKEIRESLKLKETFQFQGIDNGISIEISDEGNSDVSKVYNTLNNAILLKEKKVGVPIAHLKDISTPIHSVVVSSGSNGVCDDCNSSIGNGVECIHVLGKQFHIDHFSCKDCYSTLDKGDKFYEVNGSAYCESDYYSIFRLRCNACNSPIKESECLKALGSHYHINHFICIECKIQFKPNDHFFEIYGSPYCESHSTSFNCGGCFLQINGRYLQSPNGKRWHPDHYK